MVFLLKAEEPNQTLKARGYITPLEIGDYIELDGAIEGNEIHFSDYYFVEDEEKGANFLLKFLFGKKTAIKIISKFNNSAIEAVDLFKNREEYFKNKAEEIKGISINKIEKAYEKYAMNKTAEKIYNLFEKYGISLEEAIIIYKKIGEKALEEIKKNPYILYFNFSIPFTTVDSIALEYAKISELSQKRLFAGTMYCLLQSQKNGNTYAYLDKYGTSNGVVAQVSELLNISENTTKEIIFKLKEHNKIQIDKFDEQYIIYTNKAWEEENNISKKLSILNRKLSIDESVIDAEINAFEIKNKLNLDELQKKAIKNSLTNGVSIITGPPGSGKTTIINAIITIYEKLRTDNIVLFSPTGKAAYRMSENTNKQAYTIHRLLDYSPATQEFQKNETNKIDCGLAIGDEVSMMGNSIFSSLLSALRDDTLLVLIGDSNQLPSVEYGKVLSDLISSKRFSTTELTQIYRQKKDSSLLERIIDVANGKELNTEETSDYLYLDNKNDNIIMNSLIARYVEGLSKVKNIRDIVVLTPMNKGVLGTVNLNNILQERVNPKAPGKLEVKYGKQIFRINDLVIQCKNDKSYNVFNGMVGKIKRIHQSTSDFDLEYIEVEYPEGIVEYTRDRYDELKLAYALTIHKTQGSEYERVIMLVSEESKIMVNRRLIYTGMSRTKKHLTLIGDKNIFNEGIKKGGRIRRNSSLAWRIREEVRGENTGES